MIKFGKPFQVESDGVLRPVELEPAFRDLTPFQTEIIAMNLINRDRRLTEALLTNGSCDLSYELPGKARFRVNIFSQRGSYSIAFRKLEPKIPTIKELGLPEAFAEMSEEKNGLVVFTGATGTGKSTSLAAILNAINDPRLFERVAELQGFDPINDRYVYRYKTKSVNARDLVREFEPGS